MKKYIFILLTLLPLSLQAQTGGYNPDNPPQPNWPEDDDTKYYMLTVESIPAGAGSFGGYANTKQLADREVYITASDHHGNLFREWKDAEGNTLGTDREYRFTMPARNITIYAVYDYDPASPGHPVYVGKYLLELRCEPVVAGSFNFKDQKVEEGTTRQLQAYSNSGFQFLYWTDQKGDVLGTDARLDYLMPSHASTLTAHYAYNPEVPQNPGTNLWDASLGELVIDYFTAGRLNDAMDRMVGGSAHRAEVRRLIVDGAMTSNDWQFTNYYQQLVYLDLSRVGGVTAVPASAFNGKLAALEEIELPDGIDEIGNRAFSGCVSLRTIDCYAITPPHLGSVDVFKDVPEGLTVFVPEESVDLYKQAEGWSSFIILPLRSKVCEMEVTLPEGDYRDLSLEIINVKSGQKYKYLLNDRTLYVFPNLVRNTTYRVYIRTKSGKTLLETDNVLINEEVVKVNIDEVKVPSGILLSVQTPAGEEYDSAIVTWYDGEGGKEVGSGKSVEGLVAGDTLYAVFALPPAETSKYQTPDTLGIRIDALGKTYEPQVKLQTVEYTERTLRVEGRNAAGEVRGLGKATVTIDQFFTADYHRVVSNIQTESTANPVTKPFAIAKTKPAIVSISADGYIPLSDTLKAGEDIKETYQLVQIQNEVTGTVSVSYQTTATVVGKAGDQLNYYPDMKNVTFAVRNVSEGTTVSGFSFNEPLITIFDGFDVGQTVALTIHSVSGDFEDVTETAVIGTDRRFALKFNLKQHGSVLTRFMVTDNTAVRALLFDAEGKLLSQGLYNNFDPKALDGTDANNLRFDNLREGLYTVVAMGDSKYFSSLFDLSRFAELGLQEGVDYASKKVTVVDGTTSDARFGVVPLFQESKFYYTGENTRFAANKANVIQGNYLTLTAQVDFPAEVKSRISEVELFCPLPGKCTFVEGSLMVGKQVAGESQFQYEKQSETDHSLTVQFGQTYTDRVKFCIVPIERGNYTTTAYVRFNLDGRTITQPIGTAAFTVNDVTMWTPAIVSLPDVFVNGNAPAFSDVEIYDDWRLVGFAKALADGYWQTECSLWGATNLSVHPLQARIVTPLGIEMKTETRFVEYNELSIQAKDVDMRFFNPLPGVGRTVAVRFDLEHTTTDQPSYQFASGVEFVFTANLTNNSPEVVDSCTIRVFTNNHEWIELPARYIENLDRWVAHSKFDTQTMPIGVRVEVEADVSEQVDKQDLQDNYPNYWDIVNVRSAEPFRSPQTRNTFDMEPVGGDKIGISGTYFQDAAANIDLSLYTADTLLIPTKTNGDTIRIFTAPDGSYVVTGDNSQGSAWGINVAEQAGVRAKDIRKVRIDEVVTDYLKEAIDNLTSLAPLLVTATDRQMMEVKLWQHQSTIEKYEQGSSGFTANDYEHAKRCVAFYQAAIDNLGASVEFARKVNTLLSYARYGIEDTNEWQALSDRFLPCTGLDDPQARAMNWQSLRYTRQHGLGYYYAVSEAAHAAQMIACLFEGVENYDQFAQLSPAVLAAMCGVLQQTCDYIMDFATTSYQQNKAASRNHMRWVKRTKNKLLNCNYDMAESNDAKWDFSLPYPIVVPIIDPSGYVYEAVPANRLEGVTATAYYRRTYEDMYGDLKQEVVKWDAENYGQENPLLTDAQGMYQWDVPQGEWQVKFEKEGYQTAYSDWLPVPPPQLDVNVALTQLSQPEVVRARAFEAATEVPAGVEITFSKHMKPELLTPENIVLKGIKNGDETLIEGLAMSYPDLEEADETGTAFARKVYAATDQLSQFDEVWVIVNRRVESYAGLQMAAAFQQKLDIEKRLVAVSADTLVNVGYQGHEVLHIGALPTEAAVGRQIRIVSANPQVVTLTAEARVDTLVTLDDNGQADVLLNGALFGTTALTYDIIDEDITAQTMVNVVDPSMLEPVKAPVSSRISGTAVYRGQTVTLSCETEGATIYYTTDGSCPCESATRIEYRQPIAINEATTLKVMSVGFNGSESEVREYHYLIRQSTVVLDLAEGWNWVSHDVAE
nr:chitobiase/beta-hexosaminidase C-terminal domain-containing protein [Bacteroidaceae bacterium]